MKYLDGTEIKLGDRVELANGVRGTIVFSIDTDEYSTDFPKKVWSYLKTGVMVKTDTGALVRFEDPNIHDIFPLASG